MDFRHVSNFQLYKNLGVIKRNAKNGAKELEKLREILQKYDYPMSDANDQAEREIGFLGRIAKALSFRRRILLYLRPKDDNITQLHAIRKDLSESIYDYMRKYGKNDVHKLKEIDQVAFKDALHHYSKGMDSMLQVLELGGLLQEVKARRGSHKDYLSPRAWEIVKIVTTAICSLVTGYIIGKAKK